jgi:hypothetical protein
MHNLLNKPRDTTSWVIGGTDSFRLSSREFLASRQDYPGRNIGGARQNIEKSMRKVWQADDGYLLCQIDQSGAEALIVAYLCRDAKYRSLFKNGIKPHLYLGLKLFPYVWKKEMPDKEKEIEEALVVPIPQLPLLPIWKPLSAMIADSDNWESNRRYYHFSKKTIHCVDEQTEVLTNEGWVSVSEIPKNIMVCAKDGAMFFDDVSWNYGDYSGEMIHFKETYLDQFVTPRHIIPLVSSDKTLKLRAADTLVNYKGGRVPTSGNYIGGNSDITEDEARLIAAIQADGSYVFNKIIFHLRKDRKVDRLDYLLKSIGIKFEYQLQIVDKTTVDAYFKFDKPPRLTPFLTFDKLFKYQLLNLNRNALNAFISEIHKWDGTVNYTDSGKRQESYCSKYKRNLDIIKTLLHLSNRRGTICPYTEDVFEMTLNTKRTLSRLNWKGPAKTVNFTGKVYCPTTSTGMFLIRRNGHISITGNSGSYGMRENTFRQGLLKESGGTINLTHEQASKFLMGFHMEFPEIQQWHIRVFEQAKRTKQLRNLLGFPYNITDFVDQNDFKDLIAWTAQSTVACITRQCFVRTQHYIEQNNKQWHLLGDCHDSVLAEAPENEVLELAKVMKEYMEIELTSPLDGSKFRMRSGISIGKNWSPYKEHKNPDGLKEIKL